MSLVFAYRKTGDWKSFAAAGETVISHSVASGLSTLSVIVAGILSEFLRTQSVNRPTTTTPSSVAANVTWRMPGVPPSAGGGSSGISPMTVVPAPGPADVLEMGATGLREQPAAEIASVAISSAV